MVSAVLTGQMVSLGVGLKTAVGTKFGFVIMGSNPTSTSCSLSCPLTSTTTDAVRAY